jgi:ferrous iron transport protein B
MISLRKKCETCRYSPVKGLKPLGIFSGKADYVLALAGNPNTGKSTLFNLLTGLHQKTGNWPGKTVEKKEGLFAYEGKRYKVVDLPGTYSLMAHSEDEEVARNFLLFEKPDVSLIVADATRLERNLNLVLQILMLTDKAVLAVNMIDEAEKQGIRIDTRQLSRKLGIPVVATNARMQYGVDELLKNIARVAQNEIKTRPPVIQFKDKNLKEAVERVRKEILSVCPQIPKPGWIALRLLSGDKFIEKTLEEPQKYYGISPGEFHAEKIKKLFETVREIRLSLHDRFYDLLTENIYATAHEIASESIIRK